MAKGQPGSGQDLAALYVDLRIAMLAFLRRHTGDAHAAEDLFHEVVLKALAATVDKAPDNLTGWLYAVARNAAMDYHRRHRHTEELPDDLADTKEEAEASLQLADCLRPMAERLPARYRETVLAAEFDGRALKELAEKEGVSISAIKSRASRGRKMLQEALVACCRVVVSAQGRVTDYDAETAAGCAPAECGSPGVAR